MLGHRRQSRRVVGTDRATEQRVTPRSVLCPPTTGPAYDTTLGASSNLPVRDPAASREPESSCHHVHRQNRSPAIAPMRARCPDGRDDWPPAPALDRQKGVCRPFAYCLFLVPTHPECSPDPVRATASALPASVPSLPQAPLHCAPRTCPNP